MTIDLDKLELRLEQWDGIGRALSNDDVRILIAHCRDLERRIEALSETCEARGRILHETTIQCLAVTEQLDRHKRALSMALSWVAPGFSKFCKRDVDRILRGEDD